VDTIEAIRTRRSIRRYTREPVPDDVIAEILKAAMSAPSAGNQQPWQFVIITDRGLCEEIPTFHPYAQMVREAPVAILVCGDLRLESYKGYWQDCPRRRRISCWPPTPRVGAVWWASIPRKAGSNGFRTLTAAAPVTRALVLGIPAERAPGKPL
jgi:nitroreductase